MTYHYLHQKSKEPIIMNKMMLHHPKGVIEIDAFLKLIWSTFQFSAVEPRILHKVDAYPWAGNFGNSGVSPKMSVGFWTSSFFGFIFKPLEWSSDVEMFLLSMGFTGFTGSDDGWQWSMQVFAWAIAPPEKKLIGPHQQWCTCQTLHVCVYTFAYRWNVPSNLLIL